VFKINLSNQITAVIKLMIIRMVNHDIKY